MTVTIEQADVQEWLARLPDDYAWQAGWRTVQGCELEAEYVEIARARVAHWCVQGRLI